MGPQLSDNDSSAELNLFRKYFDDTVMKQLVDATNDYAEQKKNTKRLMYKRFKNVPLMSDEMSRYLGILLLLSISSIRSYRQAWDRGDPRYIYNIYVALNELETATRRTCKHISSY